MLTIQDLIYTIPEDADVIVYYNYEEASRGMWEDLVGFLNMDMTVEQIYTYCEPSTNRSYLVLSCED